MGKSIQEQVNEKLASRNSEIEQAVVDRLVQQEFMHRVDIAASLQARISKLVKKAEEQSASDQKRIEVLREALAATFTGDMAKADAVFDSFDLGLTPERVKAREGRLKI